MSIDIHITLESAVLREISNTWIQDLSIETNLFRTFQEIILVGPNRVYAGAGLVFSLINSGVFSQCAFFLELLLKVDANGD